MKASILTYHSHNISGADYGTNDHVALALDLELIAQLGIRIAPLREIAGRLVGDHERPERLVGLSFDDGPVFDFEDFIHPKFGPQRGFFNILRDFRARHGRGPQPTLHATSFVIASPDARAAMERAEDCGYPFLSGWLGDHWWREAASSGLMDIGNHSWDHVHHAVERIAIDSGVRDDFTQVSSHHEADREIRTAGQFIRERTGSPCDLFAYPYGHASEFLVAEYFPAHQHEHGMVAAFGAMGGAVEGGVSRWNIPRLVCGHHWKSPDELRALLQGS